MYSDTRFKKPAFRSGHLGNRPCSNFKKSILALSVSLSLCASIAHASQTALGRCTPITDTGNSNFTMLNGGGGITGGTNDVSFTWDGSFFNNSSDYTGPGSVSNATLSSTTKFQSHLWVAHDIQVFAPGSYTFNPTLGGGAAETGTLTMNVGASQFGLHMLFDWNGNNNIDVAVVVNKGQTFGSAISSYNHVTTCSASGSNCLYTGAGFLGGLTANRPAGNAIWMLASVDGNADSIPGIPMPAGGPFAGFNANFNLQGTLSPADGTCASAIDTTPDVFSFSPSTIINATLSTVYTSSTITVSGLGVTQAVPNSAQTAPISITGGSYAINGSGVYVTTAGTVSNTNTVSVRGTAGNADGMTTNVVLTIGGVSATFVISTPPIAGVQGSNFTMLDDGGGVTGGTNDVAASWDSACETSTASINFSHMSLSSTTPFFSYPWSAHHIRVFCPGTYIIDTTCTTGKSSAHDLDAGTCGVNADPTKNYTFTVGAGQIGGHMLFDWNGNLNIDVVEVWNTSAVFGPSPMYTGGGACNSAATVWNLMSTDWDGDGKNGGAMIDGPFKTFSANFNIRTSGTPLTCGSYIPTVNVGEPSGAAGCSISPAPVNTLERADWWLVAGFLAWLGAIQMRLKRKNKS